jgi:hypothetical protein
MGVIEEVVTPEALQRLYNLPLEVVQVGKKRMVL